MSAFMVEHINFAPAKAGKHSVGKTTRPRHLQKSDQAYFAVELTQGQRRSPNIDVQGAGLMGENE